MAIKTIPIFCNEFLWSSALAVLTQCYSTRGLEVVAAVNMSDVLYSLLIVVFTSLGYSVGILVGQSLGAGEFDRAKKESFTLTCFSAVICVGLAVVMILLSGVFPKLYNTTDEVRSLARGFMIISALFFPVQGILNTLYFTLRSGGKTLVTFFFDSVFSWAVSVPIALILCTLTDLPILVVFAAVQAADIIKIVIGAVMIRKGIWITDLASEFD